MVCVGEDAVVWKEVGGDEVEVGRGVLGGKAGNLGEAKRR